MHPNFCAAPFYQLTLKPNGQATPCCYHYGLQLGHVGRRGIQEVWNGAKMQALRREFISGHVQSCRGRQQSIRCHERFADLKTHVNLEATLPYPPKRLDLRLNGTCNLSCVMCEVWQEPAGVYNHEHFWSEVEHEVAPYLESCDLLGGEPFVQADTFRMIDQISAVNNTCTFAFVTNGHYPYSKKIDLYLRKIKIRYLQVSLDTLDPATYLAIRGGSHALVLKTIKAFSELRESHDQPFPLVLSMCVLKHNWREIPAFLTFCEQLGAACDFQFAHYDPSGSASLRFASREEWLALDNLLRKQDGIYTDALTTIAQPLALLLSKS